MLRFAFQLNLTFILLAVIACQSFAQGPDLPSQPYNYVDYAVTNLPEHLRTGDTGASDNTPIDNPITNDGATLGRVLFFDNQLSISRTISCASCHTPETGFGDVRQFSIGSGGAFTPRHSMGLTLSLIHI